MGKGGGRLEKEYFYSRNTDIYFNQISSRVVILKISAESRSFEKRKVGPDLSTNFSIRKSKHQTIYMSY